MSTPKVKLTSNFPKAKCSMKWGKGYMIVLGTETINRFGQTINKIETRTSNPSEAWELACDELKL